MTYATDSAEVKSQACELANALLKSDGKYLDNVVALWKIGNRLYGQCWETEFHVFGVIASDTDHLPTENVRRHCSSRMLEKSDKEVEEVIAFYKEQVTKACNEILVKHQDV